MIDAERQRFFPAEEAAVATVERTSARTGSPVPSGVATSPLVERIRRGIIGEGEVMDGPFGPRRVTYADYTASGRSLDFLEDFIREQVLPRVRQHPHRELGHRPGRPPGCARMPGRIIRDAVGGDRRRPGDLLRVGRDRRGRTSSSASWSCASRPGWTSGISSADASRRPNGRWCSSARTSTTPTSCPGASPSPRSSSSARTPTATSTWPTWRASWPGTRERPLLIGSFSAASNVTGILTDTDAIAALLHAHGALSFWDLRRRRARTSPIRVARRPAREPAITRTRCSCPRTSSPAARRLPASWSSAASLRPQRACPTAPGGGTVAFVEPDRAPVPRRSRSRARRAAPPPSSNRSGPAWSSRSSRRWAPT